MRRKEEEHMIDWVEKHVVKSISVQQVHYDLLYLLWLDLKVSVHVLFSMCVCAHTECRYPWRPESSNPMELELQTAMSHLMWVLRTILRSSERVGSECPCLLSHLSSPSCFHY